MIARPLATPRLALVPVTAAHGDAVWRATEASLSELKPWMAWAEDASPAAQADFAAGAEREWQTSEGWPFAVTYEDEVCGLIGIDDPDRLYSRAEIGYWIRSDLTGRGLVTEGASAVIGFAFDELGFHRLELHAATGNHASRRVAEKLGFREEGLLRDGSRGSGGFHDAIVYGLLATDPRPRFHLPGPD